MSHLHFGRAVPITFRRFPRLTCHNLMGNSVRVPDGLDGRLNALVIGFKTSHYRMMDSWIRFARSLKREVSMKHKVDEQLIQVYRLVIRNRSGILLRWWTDERLNLAVGDGTVEDAMPASASGLCEAQRCSMGGEESDTPIKLVVAANEYEVTPPVAAGAGSTKVAQGSPQATRLIEVRSRTLVCFTDKSAFVEALQLADSQRVYIFLVDRDGEVMWCEHETYSPGKEVGVRGLLQLLPAGTNSAQQVRTERRLLISAEEGG